MYEALEAVANDFNSISRLASDPEATAKVKKISEILKLTAARISEVTGATEQDRKNLSTLYRGFSAASRMLDQLASEDTNTY
jgi:hypothetical protein